MDEYSDKELLDQFKDESRRNFAFNLLVRKYQQKVYWHIRRMVLDHEDANDLVQNTFIKVWKNLENFRADSGLYTWIYRIATNETLTFLNQKKNRFLVPLENLEGQLSRTLEDDAYFKGDAIQKKLQEAILTLPEKQRLVFNMKYFEEMKYEHMSEVLDTSVGALKASYHHAVKKVEEFLKRG